MLENTQLSSSGLILRFFAQLCKKLLTSFSIKTRLDGEEVADRQGLPLLEEKIGDKLQGFSALQACAPTKGLPGEGTMCDAHRGGARALSYSCGVS